MQSVILEFAVGSIGKCEMTVGHISTLTSYDRYNQSMYDLHLEQAVDSSATFGSRKGSERCAMVI